jgi:hypothetical protein
MKKLSIFLAITILASTATVDAGAETQKIPGDFYRISYSCPKPSVCSAIKGGSDELATVGQQIITVYDGENGKFNKAIRFDVSQDLANIPQVGTLIPESHAEGLYCMSVGNCEGIVKFNVGGLNTNITNDFDLAKPLTDSTFLVSEVAGVWQKPELISQLSTLMYQSPKNFYFNGDIWCSSHGNCNIIGNTASAAQSQKKIDFGEYLGIKPYFISQVDGVWGKPQFLMNNKLSNRGASFLALHCKDLVNCMIDGVMIPSVAVMTGLIKKYPISGLPGSKKLGGNSGVLLGLSMSLMAGKWSPPVMQLSHAFTGAKYPKSAIKVDFPTDYYNAPYSSNIMSCLKTWNCSYAEPVA